MWPDNWTAVLVFESLSTQWRVGMSGPTGLDYAVLPTVLRLAAVPRAEWADTFECIRVMEVAALEKMRSTK